MTYNEVIKRESTDGWFRVSENLTHIFFYRRLADGGYERKVVRYES